MNSNSDFSDDMDLLQLERELQSLTPIAPRRELVQALKARMEPVPRRVKQPQKHNNKVAAFPWRRMVAPAAAAAAAVAVFNIDDTRRAGGKNPSVAANEPATAVNWEPMRMLPQFRELLNKGYVLTPDMQFVHPRYAALFNTPQLRVPDQGDSMMRVTFPKSNNRFIMPAGFETGRTNMRFE